MPTLSAFADEVSQEPKGQIEALQANGIRYVELRGALGLNVMKFSKEQAADVRRQFADGGIGVSCIASPIGKVKLDEDWHKCLDDYKRAVDLAEFFGARYIRIFSYYPPEGRDVGDFRGEVISRLLQQVDYIADRDVTLVLENESNLFGAFPERCAYLHSAIPSEKLVMAFDPANFVNMNVRNVYETCWLPLRRYVGYFHIKDFKYGEREHAVPAGTGDGNIPEMLRDAADDGYDGFLALEPHLGKAEHSTGQTGPELFKVAADALKKICADVGWRV
jgi:sugar phosphate isomerase/epimerase